jgi:MinD-like ATPase involved in chromosome partitioning or flagellar assembly
MYDYILVDFGRTLSRISLPILEMSAGIVVIVTPDISTVHATRIIVDHLQAQHIAPDRLILVNNRTVGRVWTTLEDIEREVKLSVAVMVPYELEYMTMAINAAIPFMEKFPNNAATMSFFDLAKLLIERAKRKM